MKAGGDEVFDDGAFWELAVGVCVEVATDDPAENFLAGEFFLHGVFVGDDLAGGLSAGVGDVLLAFGGVAAAVAL